MIITLLDYQALALILIGFALGMLAMHILDLRSRHREMRTKEFIHRMLREMSGVGFENRIISSGCDDIDHD